MFINPLWTFFAIAGKIYGKQQLELSRLMNLRKKFERFCLRNRDKGIPNLMLYVAIGSGLVFLMSMMNGGEVLYDILCFDKTRILQGQVWRLFSYVFTYSLGDNPIFVVISLYCFYSLGRAIEHLWGTFRFNLFYLGGILLMDIFAMICCPTLPAEVSTANMEAYYEAVYLQMFYAGRMVYYLNLTMLIAFATLYPNAQFMILFIIPVKAWVMGLLYLVLNAIEFYNLCYPQFLFPHCLFPLVGFANYLLFFGKDIANLLPLSWRARISRGQKMQYRQEKRPPIQFRTGDFKKDTAAPKGNYTHRCTVCGRTDQTDPDLEFRYCSRCNGYYCYCEDHISNHSHIE